jgi:very-short-patch-repair endonuclease
MLWQKLRNSATGFKFKRQFGIYRYIPDFYCAELKLVVEVDGIYHYEPLQQEYDAARERDLRYFGCKILRYAAAEVIRNVDGVTEDIQHHCEELRRPSPPSSPLRGEDASEKGSAAG